MNDQIAVLLESTIGSAPDMTHNLRLLGDGDMGAGILELWSTGIAIGEINGEAKGAIKTAVVFCAAGTLLWLATRKHRKLIQVESLDRVYKIAFKRGQEHEREFREFLDTREPRSFSPEDDRFCENCGVLLNVQPDFTNESGQWACTECKYVNDLNKTEPQQT